MHAIWYENEICRFARLLPPSKSAEKLPFAGNIDVGILPTTLRIPHSALVLKEDSRDAWTKKSRSNSKYMRRRDATATGAPSARIQHITSCMWTRKRTEHVHWHPRTAGRAGRPARVVAGAARGAVPSGARRTSRSRGPTRRG